HEYELGRAADGTACAVDILVYASGENSSQSMRRMLLPAIVEQHKGVIGRLVGTESDYVSHAQEIIDMERYVTSGDYAKGLQAFAALPATLQGDKALALFRLMAVQKADRP